MAEYRALPIWTDAYLADTTDLTAEEHGVYFLLLMAAWRSPDNGLPDDDVRLARIARVSLKRWKKHFRGVMLRFWTHSEREPKWRQKKLEKVKNAAERFYEQKKLAGKASALKRKNSGSTDVDAPLQRKEHGEDNGEATFLYPVSNRKKESSTARLESVAPRAEPRPDAAPGSPSDGEGEPPGQALLNAAMAIEKDVYAETRRYCPHSKDRRTCDVWAEMGVDGALLAAVLEPRMAARKRAGEPPAKRLAYFTEALREAQREGTAAKPNGSSGQYPWQVREQYDALSPAYWRLKVKYWREQGFWLEEWGAKPGELRSYVPHELWTEEELAQIPEDMRHTSFQPPLKEGSDDG
jgi:uncharacterized protein YdaU (DUF1376 family)